MIPLTDGDPLLISAKCGGHDNSGSIWDQFVMKTVTQQDSAVRAMATRKNPVGMTTVEDPIAMATVAAKHTLLP